MGNLKYMDKNSIYYKHKERWWIKNIDSLKINITGTAASIWIITKDNCEIISEMTKINVQEELQTIKYTNNDDFPTHLSIMHSKLSQVCAMGATILDNTFKVILLNSLPKIQNSTVAPLYNNTFLTEAIQQLDIIDSK